MFLEKDDEVDLVRAYGVLQFPTIVFTDSAGEAVESTIQPEGSDEALKALDFARRWIRGEVDPGD